MVVGKYSPNPPEAIKDFAPYLAVLNRRPNVKLIGYIATNYGLKSTSNVKVAVDQYAAWTKAEGWTAGTSYDIHMDGIFFDDIDTSPKQLAHNKAISKYAKTKFASQKGPVVLNPGTTVQSGSESLFDVSNAIMDIEACYTKSAGRPDFNGYACDPTADGYSQFTPATLNKLGTNLTRVGRSSVVVHDFYETWRPYNTATTTQLKTYVDAIVKKRVHSFYISQLGYTSNFTAKPASISNVAKLAALAQNLV